MNGALWRTNQDTIPAGWGVNGALEEKREKIDGREKKLETERERKLETERERGRQTDRERERDGAGDCRTPSQQVAV